MIQRIQTIWMLVGAIVLALLFKLPMAKSLKGESEMVLNGTLETPDHIGLIILNALTIGLIVLSILLFKNRQAQQRINALNMLLILVLPILAYFLLRADLGSAPLLAIMPGTFFPALTILLLILANRAIRKDDKLVKSADRLR